MRSARDFRGQYYFQRRRRWLGLALSLALGMASTPARASGPYGSGDRFALLFLDDGDLPSAFGEPEISDLKQEASFQRAGGSHAVKVYRVANDQTQTLGQIFDLRYVFSDAA